MTKIISLNGPIKIISIYLFIISWGELFKSKYVLPEINIKRLRNKISG